MSLTQMLFNEQLHTSQVQAAQHAGLQQARMSPEDYARQQLAVWNRHSADQRSMPSLLSRGLDSSNAARYISDSEQAARKSIKVESTVGISPLIPAGVVHLDPLNFEPKPVKREPVKPEIAKPAPTETKCFGLMTRFARKPKSNTK